MLTEQILIASEVAANAHVSQKDKSGHAYICHPMRVAFMVPDICKPVALLHDVLEDTHVSTTGLLRAGIASDIVLDVECLSKRVMYPDETNREYRDRVLVEGTLRAWIVKLADLSDNLDRRRGWELPSGMRTKYEEFQWLLEQRLVSFADSDKSGLGKVMVSELVNTGLIRPEALK